MVNIATDAIALPREKVDGARRTISQSVYDHGEMLPTGSAFQELRGYYTHWAAENPTWHDLARPVDVLLGFLFPDEIGARGASSEMWVGFWLIISWIGEHMENDWVSGEPGPGKFGALLNFVWKILGPTRQNPCDMVIPRCQIDPDWNKNWRNK